ncbi:MAG TPA: DUF294 nucleotidyltransferase-like domain-containing protein [Bacillota bacterium]|nr:DUF294 nucleotidyltransferase-like domain-containing protein [Bacillota bacterium]
MDLRMVKEFIASHSIFGALTEQAQQLLIDSGEVLTITSNHFVIHENQENQDVFLLLSGTAKNTFINDDGVSMAVLFYQPGDCIGIISAVTHRKTQFSVQALSDLELLRIPHHLLYDLVRNQPTFAEKMVRMVGQRLDNLYQKVHEEYSYHSHGLDTLPYRKRIGEIMSHPVLVAQKHNSLLDIVTLMNNQKVSSLVIVEKGTPIGIVTQKDIIKILATKPHDIFKSTVEQIMTQELLTLSPEAFFYEALLMMVRHHVKHIPVVTSTGNLVGMITMRNLTQARGNSVLSVVDWVESQTTIEGLTEGRKQILHILESMLKENASAHEMCSLVTELNDRILRKIIQFAEQELLDTGIGPAPVNYCWLTLGSEGRREQTLGTDQDNAIIYSDVRVEEQDRVRHYFHLLAEKVVNGLEFCGFPRCPGGVMAVNPRWSHSVSEWKKEIEFWHAQVDGEEIRNFTIFLDFRGVYGEQALADDIKNFIITERSHFILNRLAQDDAEFHIPLGLFGRIITEKDHSDVINLKHSAAMHIVNAMRILALDKGISSQSTLERLKELHQLGIFTEEEMQEITEAFNYLMVLRIRANMRQIKNGEELTNFISLKSLNKSEFIQLKKALSTAKWVQQMISRLYYAGGNRL